MWSLRGLVLVTAPVPACFAAMLACTALYPPSREHCTCLPTGSACPVALTGGLHTHSTVGFVLEDEDRVEHLQDVLLGTGMALLSFIQEGSHCVAQAHCELAIPVSAQLFFPSLR